MINKGNLAVFAVITALGMLFLPDALFSRPSQASPRGGFPDATPAVDSAAGFLHATAELSHAFVKAGEATPVSMRIRLKAPVTTRETRLPMDLVVVLDRSGSMAGENRIAFAHRGVMEAVSRLEPTDRFALVTFSDYVETIRGLASVEEDQAGIRKLVEAITPEGSTNLSGGMEEAGRLLREARASGRRRQILLLSDGRANIGLMGPDLVDLGTRLGQEGIVVSAMGVGSDYDVNTFINLAEGSGGGSSYVTTAERIPNAISGELARADRRIIDDLRIALTLKPGVTLQRAYKHQIRQAGSRVEILAPSLGSGEEKSIVLDLMVSAAAGRGRKEKLHPVADIHVSYSRPDSERGLAEERRQLSLAAAVTADPERVANFQNLDLLGEKESLRADIAWAASSTSVISGDYSRAAAELRAEADRLEKANARLQSPSVASRIGALFDAATRIETRSFFGGSAKSEGTMGQNQASLSAGIY